MFKNINLDKIKEVLSSKKAEYCFVLLFTFIAFALRFWGLQGREFWYDEAYTGLLAKMSLSDMFNVLKFDSHPPVYIFLLRAWIHIFGTADISFRLLSVILGVLIIPITYLFLSQIEILKNNKTARWLALVIITINPFLVGYSQEARSYALVVDVFLLLSLSFYKAAFESRYKFGLSWAVFAILCSVAFLTHYALVFGIAGLLMWDFFFNKRSFINWKDHIIKKIILYILVAAIFFIGIYPFLYLFIEQLENAPVLWWIPIASFQDVVKTLYIFYFGADTNNLGVPPAFKFTDKLSIEAIGFIFYSVLLSSATYLFSKVSSRYKRVLGFLIFGSFVPIILNIFSQYLGKRLYLERYLIAYLPLLIILSAIILSKAKKVVIAGLIFAYIGLSTFIILNRSEYPSGYKVLADTLAKHKITNTIIVFEDPIQFTTAKYYLKDSGNELKIYNKDMNLDDWELTDPSEILNSYQELGGRQRIFVSNYPTRSDIWYRDTAVFGNLFIYSTVYLDRDMASGQ